MILDMVYRKLNLTRQWKLDARRQIMPMAIKVTGAGVMAFLAIGTMPAKANIINYTVTINELNSSGVSGGGTLAFDTNTNILTVNYTVNNLESGVHPQHIHGLFVEGVGVPGGTPTDSLPPTLANDADNDGVIEVLEGAASYGDILLSLSLTPGAGDFPNLAGTLNYSQMFDLSDLAVFQPPSIASGNTYSMPDLLPLDLREIVIHGGSLALGIGAGTDGEADGSGGYKAVLPVAAGTIELAQVSEPGTLPTLAIGVGLVAFAAARRLRPQPPL